ncbi:hypothetical protein AB1Y20_003297 [Prymnesium parvum]|uniref:Uncharacterized protein n=1 Tax=Prymnesium parvum TaxID=97485 RepID=A0AB34JB68_PRYPA
MLHSAASTTLVVVIGSQRGGEQVWQSMITHLIQPLRADLAVLASFDQSHELLLQHAQHIWRVGEYRDWGVLITELVGAGWQANVTLTDNLWGGVHVAEKQNGKVVLKELAGSGAILLALRLLVLRFLDNLHGHSYTQADHVCSEILNSCVQSHPNRSQELRDCLWLL